MSYVFLKKQTGRLLYVDKKLSIIQKKGVITFEYGDRSDYINIPFKGIRKVAVKFRILQRAFRTDIRACAFFNGNFIFAVNHFIYCYDLNNKQLFSALQLPNNMSAPLNISIIENSRRYPNGLYFGEYYANDEKHEVKVWYSNDGKRWSNIYTFGPNKINHIHNVSYDSKHDDLFVLSGDFGDCCNVWKVSDGFESVKPLFNGGIARTCNIFCLKDNLYFATDYPDKINHLYRIDMFNHTNHLTDLGVINGSSIYGVAFDDSFYFSSTVEHDYCYRNRLDFYLSRKKGKGIIENKSVLYKYDGNKLEIIAEFKKDFWPLNTFQFGSISFPVYGCNLNELYYFGHSIKQIDGKTVCIRRG